MSALRAGDYVEWGDPTLADGGFVVSSVIPETVEVYSLHDARVRRIRAAELRLVAKATYEIVMARSVPAWMRVLGPGGEAAVENGSV